MEGNTHTHTHTHTHKHTQNSGLVHRCPVDANQLSAEFNIKNVFPDKLGSESLGFVLQAIYKAM